MLAENFRLIAVIRKNRNAHGNSSLYRPHRHQQRLLKSTYQTIGSQCCVIDVLQVGKINDEITGPYFCNPVTWPQCFFNTCLGSIYQLFVHDDIDFAQTLDALPDNVARSVMVLIGELAAGEPAAFVGMRRLRVRHEICRVRVAADYRLLFKLPTGKLEILDLINRRDFEKWLKTLG